MLKNKVTEFYVEVDDFYIEFAKMIENRPRIHQLKGVTGLVNYLIQR